MKEGREELMAAREYSEDSLISFAAWSNCFLFTLKNELEQAIKYGELAVEKAKTTWDSYASQAALAWARCRASGLEKGIEPLAQLVQVCIDRGLVSFGMGWMPMLAEAYLMAAQHGKAREVSQETAELAQRHGGRYFLGWASRLLGEIALATNEDDSAPYFEKAICIAQQIKAENELALAYSGMGRFHKQQGNTAQAREYLAKALEIFERLGTLIEPDKVRNELAELAD